MTDIESLRRLTEAVETAGADIAPTYAEYVQLAFAIATDCGEAGREFFHRLCRMSAKYQREHAERIFSNALTTRHGEVHLGTAFHLAETANVKLCNTEVMNNRRNTENTENTPSKVLTHAHVYNKVENDEPDESEELLNGSDPNQPLPTFPEADWPKILLLIMSYATSPTQRDVMLIGALTAIGASMERYVRCPYAGKLQSPCLQSFIVAPSASGKGILSLIRLLVEQRSRLTRKRKPPTTSWEKSVAKWKLPKCPKTECFSSRAITPEQVFCKISWMPTAQDLSAKPKRIPSPLLSVLNTDTGAIHSAKHSTTIVCRTTGAPTRNTGR